MSWSARRLTWNWSTARVVATPMTAQTPATTATSATSSRVRSDHPAGRHRRSTSLRRLEDIPRSAQCVDHRSPPGVDLLAQVRDVQLDDVRLAAEVVVPHPVQDLRLAQYPARVAHQEPQQLELGRGQLNRLARTAHLATVLVQTQVTHHQQ